MSTKYSKGISQRKYGPSFGRNAVGVTFHTQNHGLSAMNQNGLAIERGTTNHIKLEKKVVDRRELLKAYGTFLDNEVGSSASCIENGGRGDRSQDFGWPAWTKKNCQFYTTTLYWSSCSYMQTVGLSHDFYQKEDTILKKRNLTYIRRPCNTDLMLDYWNQTLQHSLATKAAKIGELETRMNTSLFNAQKVQQTLL